jgi:selenocysteine lyase/cysteine desulfurase
MLSAMLDVSQVTGADFAALRSREFSRLDANGHAYLDHTGSALYPESLVEAHATMLRRGVFGNPHAENPASLTSTTLIDSTRHRVLAFFDADPVDYVVCFTANATAAMMLVGSAFRFGAASPFILSADNHNSVNGIREFARTRGASVHCLSIDEELRLRDARNELDAIGGCGLLAYPAQSNFSGVKHSLALVNYAQSLGHRVLLDAAAFTPASRLSLREVPADFVAVSFYKMFGYPTGVGCLIARREALDDLERPWFSGGTVDFVSVQNDMHALRPGGEGFEDGTANFLGIAAVSAGLDFLDDIGVESIGAHSAGLTNHLMRHLSALQHENGASLVEIYGPVDDTDRGATIAFNVKSASGAIVPYSIVESRARAARISIRGGCFCNPGAAEAAFGFDAVTSRACLQSAADSGWSIDRFRECMPGTAVGALRASFGAASNVRDARRLVAMVASFAGAARKKVDRAPHKRPSTPLPATRLVQPRENLL